MQPDEINLKRTASIERESGKVIGLCHGCFDIIHFGHVEHFKLAKSYCDILFVSVTSDKFVNKGPGRPYNRIEHRLVVLKALENIDHAFESNHNDAIWSLTQVRPNYFFKGSDYKEGSRYNANFVTEKSYAESIGAMTIFTDGETSSSTDLFKKLMSDSHRSPLSVR